MTINGDHFGADTQVDLGAGVAVGAVAVNAAETQLRAAITVASTAAVGPQPLTVTTAGWTVTASFTVGDATVPVVTVTEPADGAEFLSRTVTVRGTVSEPAEVTVNGCRPRSTVSPSRPP